MRIGAVILAAGKGSRMGQPKWQLKMPDGNYIYHTLIKKFSDYGCKTVLVVNEDDYSLIEPDVELENIDLAINNRLDFGRLYSLQCGLKKLPSTQMCFVHNIDNPYVNNDLLSRLERSLSGYDFALPEFERRGGHPLLIGSKLIERILNYVEIYPDFREVLAEFSGKRVPYKQPEILLNINTPEDYQKFIEKDSSTK